MPGLVPGVHASERSDRLPKVRLQVGRIDERHGVDGRDKPGHDGMGCVHTR